LNGGIPLKVVKNILYLKPGAKSTADLVEAVAERAKEAGVSSVVVASTKGRSALKLAEALKGAAGVVSVTEFTYDGDLKKQMKKLGVTAIERADLPLQDRRGMRDALLFFGAGVKAALEAAVIAAEKGVAQGKVMTVAGSRGGLDTALIVRPAPPSDLSSPDPEKRMKVLEIIAMPLGE